MQFDNKALFARRYPGVFALAGVVAGIILADCFLFPLWMFLLTAIVILPLMIIAYFKGEIYLAGFIGLLGLMAMAAFSYTFHYRTFPPGHIIHYVTDEKSHIIYGTVDDWPILRDKRTDIFITVDSIAVDDQNQHASGRVLLNIQMATTRLQYGDRVIFETHLYPIKGGKNPSGFDRQRYLGLKGVWGAAYLPNQFSLQVDPVGRRNLYRSVNDLRNAITGTFYKTLDTNSAALASGFLIGETKDIPLEIYNLFRDSGTLHLLAVSGSNVALVVILFAFILKASPFRAGMRTAILLIIIFLFSFLAYNQASVVRAAIMATLVLLGRVFQRRIDYNNIIATAALLILLVKPSELFDIGFQLSFFTAWGLILLYPLSVTFAGERSKHWSFRFILMPLIICLIAEFVSLPLSAYYFQKMPVISFLSNLIVGPLVSIISIGEIILLIAAFVLPVAGTFVGTLLNPLIDFTIYCLKIFSSANNVLLINHSIPGSYLLCYYVLIALLAVGIFSKAARRLTVFYCLLAANILIITTLPKSESEYCLTVFSIPEGIMAVNHSTPGQVIFSGLPLKDYYLSEKILLPYLKNNSIEGQDIISLSSGYQTLREALFLRKNGAGKIYLPQSARSAFDDIIMADTIFDDSASAIFYSGLTIPAEPIKDEAFLGQDWLVYCFGKSTILVLSDLSDSASISSALKDWLSPTAVVAADLSEREIGFLLWEFSPPPQFIVCNKVTKSGTSFFSEWKETQGNARVSLVETSKSGAVDIVIRNGQLVLTN